jgi:hypothetical protein
LWARVNQGLESRDINGQRIIGDGEDALARFRAAQDAAQARDERGWELRLLRQTAAAHLERGELTEAVERLQAAVALQPDAEAYSTLGAR